MRKHSVNLAKGPSLRTKKWPRYWKKGLHPININVPYHDPTPTEAAKNSVEISKKHTLDEQLSDRRAS